MLTIVPVYAWLVIGPRVRGLLHSLTLASMEAASPQASTPSWDEHFDTQSEAVSDLRTE